MTPPSFTCFCLCFALATLHLTGNSALKLPFANGLMKKVELRIYGRFFGDSKGYLLHSQAHAMLVDRRFNESKPTVLYIHGYTEHPESASVKSIVSALLRLRTSNVMLLDWSHIADRAYVVGMLFASMVGRALAERLDAWDARGELPLSNLHVVGLSLGAQVAGFAGKHVKQGKLPRITGLDPAYPGFWIRFFTGEHLSKSDALFVDVIHTDAGHYGIGYATGHADFFPNGGRRVQPGCPAKTHFMSDDDFCSHQRSWQYFSESIDISLQPYYGQACGNNKDFVKGRCTNLQVARMGYFASSSTRGNFYLQTADSPPFSKATNGIIPV